MPNEIEVLLACEIDGKIKAKNCPANIIYIKDPKTNQYYLEKYVVCDNYENCDNDILLKYRKYKKHTLKKSTHLFFQSIPENENKGVLYRANPFMDITTTIDD